MRLSTIAIALAAVCWIKNHPGGDSVPAVRCPSAPAPEPAGPAARLSIWPGEESYEGRRYHLGGCVSPPLDFWSSGLPLGAYFLEPDGDILLLVDPARGMKREVPLLCGMLTHRPAAGSRLALGAPGDARLVAYRLVGLSDLL